MIAVIIMDYVDTVGVVASSGTAYLCCFHPSAYVRTLTVPSLLTLKILGIRVRPASDPWSGVSLIWG